MQKIIQAVKHIPNVHIEWCGPNIYINNSILITKNRIEEFDPLDDPKDTQEYVMEVPFGMYMTSKVDEAISFIKYMLTRE